MSRKLIAFFVMMMAFTVIVGAQDILPRPGSEVDENANIVWPPPVYTLRGEIDLYGTANVPDMTSYFVEFRPITFPELDEAGNEIVDPNAGDDPWFPATLPNTQPVIQGVLGTWNTETAPDDLYELRLVINVRGSQPMYVYVSPLRIENEPSEFVPDSLLTGNNAPLPTATRPSVVPTLLASPTPLDTTPRVTARLDANVRSGDGLGYSIVDTLPEGTTARVVGISTSGNGWYLIDLPNGTRGWIAPSVVISEGDLRSVPRVNPPASPTPPATATPVPSGNLTGTPPSLSVSPPTCNVGFEILVNITNNGTASTNSPASVTIQDVHVASGQVQTSFTREIPALSPGQNWVVGGPMTVSTFYNEEHRIEVILDTGGQVNETNESDNRLTTNYTLAQGGC